jgi:hypothetical protein
MSNLFCRSKFIQLSAPGGGLLDAADAAHDRKSAAAVYEAAARGGGK